MTNKTGGLTEAQKNYPNDQKRIRTQKAALLDLLHDRKWHPNYQLAEVGGLSFNSYLYQLRLARLGDRIQACTRRSLGAKIDRTRQRSTLPRRTERPSAASHG